MAKKNKKAAKASSKAKATSKVVANVRLVEAIRASDQAMKTAQSLLVTVAEIVQSEDLTRNEVVASIMEARGVEETTAQSQYSRMKALLNDPETLQELKDGVITLKAAREKTKGTKTVSPKKKKENAEKKLIKGIGMAISAALESGWDWSTFLNTTKSAAKKAGLR